MAQFPELPGAGGTRGDLGAPVPRDPALQPPDARGYNWVDDEEGDGIDFWRLWRVLKRRRWMILAFFVGGLASAGAWVLTTTPLYSAKSTIEIQRQESQIMEGAGVDPVVIADAEHMATQNALLRSRALSERVAEVLDLPADKRYVDLKGSRDARLAEATEVVQENLRVTPVARSRVIEIAFVSPYPSESARVANAIAENFIESNLERKFNATSYARTFLEERLKATKTALEASERQLVEYARDHGILDFGAGDASQVTDSLEASSLKALSTALTEAQDARIKAEERFTEVKTSRATLDTLTNETIRDIRTRRAALWSQYQDKLTTFKADYPDMVEMKSQIDALDQEISNERDSVIQAMEGEYRAALARENSLKARVAELSGSLQNERDTRIDYNILRREVDTNRSQYEALLQRLKEVSITAGVTSSQVAIVDRAKVPERPFSPNLLRTLLIAIVLSIGAGVGVALALDYIDDTVKAPEDVMAKLGLPAIGVVPKAPEVTEGLSEVLSDPRSHLSEAISSARTALQFSTPYGAPRSMLVTSTRPGEGKSSAVLGLALSFAGAGRKVLIIDADMRKPTFSAPYNLVGGLSALLTGAGGTLRDNLVPGTVENLFLLPAGTTPPNPAELLSSPLLHRVVTEAENLFDIVIVDAPPVLGFADAPLLAAACQGTLLVVQAGVIRRPAVQRTIGRLLTSRATFLGALLSQYNLAHESYGYGYDYGYGYGGEGDDGSRKRGRSSASAEAEAGRKIEIFNRSDRGPHMTRGLS